MLPLRERESTSIQDLSYVVLFIALLVYIVMSTSATVQPEYEQYIEIEVSAGDTLWAIASENIQGGMSIPSFIMLVKGENNLTSNHIYPGQILLIPQLQSREGKMLSESNHLLSSKY